VARSPVPAPALKFKFQVQPIGFVMPLAEDTVREQLKKVIDPELFVNIVDLGLVYVVDIADPDENQKQDIHIEMTLTSPMCPAGPQLVAECKQFAGELEEAGKVEVKVVMDPPWTPERMTDDARDQLGIF
jgi:metal-sulfur cluster biosynthetic enzyme